MNLNEPKPVPVSDNQGFSPEKWMDVSNEKSRTYIFAGGVEVTIIAPVRLYVKRSARPGWFAIVWEGKNGVAFDF